MKRPNILVVEDEGIVALEIKNRLDSLGYKVVSIASSGEVAIEKAIMLQPDLVLMDIRLKGDLDGISAAEQIRSKLDIPIIFLTAYADERTLQRAKVSAPYGYVLKPFEERELQIAIEIALYKHRTEAELAKAQRLESLGILAGGIAHQFNNSLSVIISTIALIKMKLSHDQSLYTKLERVETATWQAADAAQQLLTFSTGGAPIRQPTALAEIVAVAADLAFKTANVSYKFSASADLWPVQADPGQIGQVFINLFTNADQAMPNGGLIQVSATNLTDITPPLLPHQVGYVKISVKDQGEGIPSELMTKIFDPYFTTRPNATGLGLTTVYSIIKRHDGYIEVESVVGEGSSFHLYLPAAELPKVAAIASQPTFAISDSSCKKILLMDDEELIRETCESVLEFLGYATVLTANGDEAIQRYQQASLAGAPFDVVILDLTIVGGMGGKETIQHLLEIDPAVKAIVSSGYSHDSVMANFKDYGFCGVLAKPYTIEEMKVTLAQLLG